MHINEVFSILKDCLSEKDDSFDVKAYNDGLCCVSDFVVLRNHKEFAYVKYDEKGEMDKKSMNLHEEKMGTAAFYVVVKDTDAFIPADLPCTVFPRNTRTPIRCSTDTLLQTLTDFKFKDLDPISVSDLLLFFEKTYSSLIRGRMKTFFDTLNDAKTVDEIIVDLGCYFMFRPEYETLFFQSLLGSASGMPKKICRYTTLAGLFRTLNEKQQSMCNVVCMNDKTETDYAKRFLGQAMPSSNLLSRWAARTMDDGSDSLYFLLSGSRMTKKDDLGLWRMYGEDTKGVSLRYEVNEPLPEGFCLAKVSYAKRDAHAELTYLASKLCKALKGRSFEVNHLHSWLHFFKPEEYAMEEEVRLLYSLEESQAIKGNKLDWILNAQNGIVAPLVSFSIDKNNNAFPLVLSGIVLGPNLAESDVNVKQLSLMIKHNQIKTTDNFEITKSSIDSYRR